MMVLVSLTLWLKPERFLETIAKMTAARRARAARERLAKEIMNHV